MVKYIVKRIVMVPVMLLCAALLVYVLLSISAADPLLNILPDQYTQEDYDALEKELGLDKPVLIQYGRWVVKAVQGDLGTSYKTRGPVWEEVGYRIPTSVKLAGITVLCVVLLGLPLGVLCAVKQYRPFDGVVNVISKLLGAVPNFWLGLMMMMWFGLQRQWFPIYGTEDGWRSWVLPVFTLFLPFLANYIRQVRSAMLDCIRRDYVRTARSKGAKESRVIFHDALKNALLPIITMTGSMFANMLGGAVVVEKLFAIPGIGLKIVESVNNRDTPVLLVCAVVLGTFTIIINLLIDLSYAVVDPRIRGSFAGKKKRKKEPKKLEGVA